MIERNCARKVCGKPGATFFNEGSFMFYCPDCADEINYWSKKDHGVLLCRPYQPGDESRELPRK